MIDLASYGYFKERVQEGTQTTDTPCFEVEASQLVEAMTTLKEKEAYLMLLDHVAVDWLEKGTFELFYELYSLKSNQRLRISVSIDRSNAKAPSVSSVWKCAEFQEREVFDLMGISYEGHPDLRRLFLEDDWDGYPLRKDYKDDFMLELPDHVK
ncbi:MAG: NADH-quinone oxidoreductase subunit C [Bdellovibrionaceae bacterium]|jgi:NADH-quinone oxidoreductase subunit C|nr:NADH-quinone oxidoreductase subunit C [Pseudobdellovibrionaceae bacterium]